MPYHLLVERSRKSIDRTNLDKGCVVGRRYGLDVRVSPKSLDRALKIMDILIKKLETKGAQVSIIKKDYKSATSVNLSGAAFEIDIYEKMNIIKSSHDKFGFNRLDYIPNGHLVLRIKNVYASRSEWRDGKRNKVEDLIDNFIDGLHAAVAREKEIQKRNDEWRKEQVKREEAERLKALEQERIDNLEKDAINWQRGQMIHAYVEAVIAAYIQKNGKVQPGSEFDQWKTWASSQATRLILPLSTPAQPDIVN